MSAERVERRIAESRGGVLDLSSLELTEVPDVVRGLSGVVELRLHGNPLLTSLPDWIGELTDLKTLILGGELLNSASTCLLYTSPSPRDS